MTSLSSLQLDAFIAVARENSFSRAANKLHISQSALSQRILNLEQLLGSTLIIRESTGIRLTELGSRLLRYCQLKESLEADFLANIQTPRTEKLSGIIRIAGFSTITQSVLVPVLGELIQKHPALQIELMCKELRELPNLLESGQADFIFMTRPIDKQGIENILLGHEEYVLIQPQGKKFREDVYLDHDEEDTTTTAFFKIQNKPPERWQRSYLDDIYLIITGVQEGLGRAVVPFHIAGKLNGIEIVSGKKPLPLPVYLLHYSQSFYTRLQQCVFRPY
ncbi:LysR family transcriptional regulator [Aquicella lusitana]|uniref:DNA-binding transcriptional LysR family regulator n=1 Tax=Aquicella lusitana TaxID=254246 RepID=A0A370G2S6_9COXI|nr:LysR family transcriptional regulator [Aquicella lusitana]RDI37149.1 DNA-binding transcriptional LysR family regulator [Aquicella lusitana]VVC72549.1 HTH-type transcriptional regulator CynR [Aquicella lusitana]